jgi:hypothetical protein
MGIAHFWATPVHYTAEAHSGVSEYANRSKYYKINGSSRCGRVAQLGEHLLCKQGVTGSIPVTSTNSFHVLLELRHSNPVKNVTGKQVSSQVC